MTREDELKQALAELDREYKERAKPIIDELLQIKMLEQPRIPVLCGSCRLPIQEHSLLGSVCDCAK